MPGPELCPVYSYLIETNTTGEAVADTPVWGTTTANYLESTLLALRLRGREGLLASLPLTFPLSEDLGLVSRAVLSVFMALLLCGASDVRLAFRPLTSSSLDGEAG